MTVHELKCWPRPFEAMRLGRKRFEFRREDRERFDVGDELALREWDPEHLTDYEHGRYTGRALRARVTYVLRDGVFGLPRGYVVMSVEVFDLGMAAEGRR